MCTLQPLGSLHLLASENDVPALTFLLDNRADLNSRDEEGCTALHWAADRGSLQVAPAVRLPVAYRIVKALDQGKCAEQRGLSLRCSPVAQRLIGDGTSLQMHMSSGEVT